jgi:hypothetical protein
MLGRLTGSGKNPALPRFRSPEYNDHLIRERAKALSPLRREHTLRKRYAPPFLMCPTRHVMVIYYLHHCNFRCTVSLIYVECWHIQRRGYYVKSQECSSLGLLRNRKSERKSSWRERLTTCFNLPITALNGLYC